MIRQIQLNITQTNLKVLPSLLLKVNVNKLIRLISEFLLEAWSLKRYLTVSFRCNRIEGSSKKRKFWWWPQRELRWFAWCSVYLQYFKDCKIIEIHPIRLYFWYTAHRFKNVEDFSAILHCTISLTHTIYWLY